MATAISFLNQLRYASFCAIGVLCFCIGSAKAQGLLVNEVSNGPSGNKEYVELVVNGTPCSTVDLRGWIVDDNNGDFACGPISGVGIAQGHIKFDSVAAWSAIPVGAIILIHNDGDVNALIPANDPTDSNLDSIYIVPVTSTLFRRGSGTASCPAGSGDIIPMACDAACPASNSSSSYLPCANVAGGNNAQMSLANGGDAMQTRQPNGAYYHGISYGNATITGGPDGLKVSTTTSGGGRVWSLTDGNPRTVGSWSQGTDDGVAGGSETPGVANTAANAAFITALLGDCGVLGPLAVSLEAWRHADGVKLEWIAVGDPSPERFVVERITQQGEAFAPLAEIAFSAQQNAYSFSDVTAPENFSCLYRVRSILADGREILSPVVEVKTFAELNGGVAVFPNPTSEMVHFQFDAEGEGELMLTDLQGRIVFTSGEQFFAGFSELTADLGRLAPGIYAWQLRLQGTLLQGRVVRQ